MSFFESAFRGASAGLMVVLLSACAEPVTAPARAIPAVSVVTLSPERVTLTRELPGRVRPFLVAEVRPQVDGIVRERLFQEGGTVEAGQALYQLDDATYRADLASAEAAVVRAEAAVHTARLNAERAGELIGRSMISKQDHDLALAQARQAEADVQAARAAAQRHHIQVAHARISAPISGSIGKSAVTRGALVTASQDPLVTVQQLDPVYVDLSWSSRELLELRQSVAAGRLHPAKDVPVTIVLEDGSRYGLPGTTSFADLTVDPGTGSFDMRVEVPNPDGLLLPGMYVRAVVTTGMLSDALLVPQQGVSRDARGDAWVLTVGAEQEVQRRAIDTGATIGDRWLVESGLQAGDRVIVEGVQKVQPGAPVQVAEWQGPGPTGDLLPGRAGNAVGHAGALPEGAGE